LRSRLLLRKCCCGECTVTGSGTIDVTFIGIDANICGCFSGGSASISRTMYETLDGTYTVPLFSFSPGGCLFRLLVPGAYGRVDFWSTPSCTETITQTRTLDTLDIYVNVFDDAGVIKTSAVGFEITNNSVSVQYLFFGDVTGPKVEIGDPVLSQLGCGGNTTCSDGGTATVSIPS